MNEPMSDALLNYRLMEFDGRFPRTGGVDLMAMSSSLPESLFREYIELSREWRTRRRR
jgi:hypothetical protein